MCIRDSAKYRDYFTSCLPAPQKSEDVAIPVSSGANYPVLSLSNIVPTPGTVPVKWNDANNVVSDAQWLLGGKNYNGTITPNDISLTEANTGPIYSAVTPINLWAVNDGSVSSATINE